ncbi:LOW QUALITY PROTEIN: hypothetical protein PanWU01x14_048530 [Parasponia andersonii]|uniref:Uncharacterized protein n=1 Tax=Parasponia andersonii TaxID=3476 RepID=A0A2P5DND8_PARAD|nr:LOW QUALITY PROTEIN: hypothetical protein PanWU01x14_048530 [Parasponia andersonii]
MSSTLISYYMMVHKKRMKVDRIRMKRGNDQNALEPNITFNKLLDRIYRSIEIDHSCFDVELSYKPKTTIDIALITVKNDRDVMVFICWQKKDNIPLCMTLVRKFENIVF